MKKIENNILDKVELYLEQYKDDNSIYYQELKNLIMSTNILI